MPIVIGLIAEKESGKTTTFNFLKSRFPEAQEVMLAEHLKNVCVSVFGLTKTQVESQAEKQKPFSTPLTLSLNDVNTILELFELNSHIGNPSLVRHVGKEIKTPREALQYVGTEILRSIEDDIHLKWAMKLTPKSDVYVVTDIRFPNEFNFFKAKGSFISVFIDRTKKVIRDEASNHQSEQHIQNMKKQCMVEIDNNTNDVSNLTSQLDSQVVSYAQYLLQKR